MAEMPNATATAQLFQRMIDNVAGGVWKAGEEIPSERALMSEFSASRLTIREALSMLRGLGVLDVSHGRRTRVRQVPSETFSKLLPLMLACGGQQTFEQVFEVRLALEVQSAALAAERRSDLQLQRLAALVEEFRELKLARRPEANQSDFGFHVEIARASGNPLFPTLLESLTAFVIFAQHESCRNDTQRIQRAIVSHEAIFDAIYDCDANRARAEMEAHLRYSMTRQIQDFDEEDIAEPRHLHEPLRT